MTDSTYYNNVACVIISQDENSEAWVHLGVELRGQGKNRAPHLSTFGGAIDMKDGKKEGVIEALQREVREEFLGLLDDEITSEKITNRDLFYSFVYTNTELAGMPTTVVFAIMVDHQKMQHIKKQFDKERHERLFQTNGKKFNTRSESEVKQIRSVRLTDLKAHLQASTPILCSEKPSSFLSLDRDSLTFDAQNNLRDYRVLCEGNRPKETVIPCLLPLRHEIAESLKKMLPGLGYHFFNIPIIAGQELATGFYGKSIRADEFSFIEEFVATTPIKGLTSSELSEKKTAKRNGRRGRATSRGTEIIDLNLKKTHSIAKQYTEKQKVDYSNAQSISYFSVPDGTPVFGWTKERHTQLLGVAGLDMLPNRLFIYDAGTVCRPYDENKLIQLKEYVRTKKADNIIFDVSELELFKEKIKATGDQNYNEILGRIRWNIDQTSICVFSDNIETRWIAINWAGKFNRKIQEKSLALHQQEKITKAEYEKFSQYQSKISYYNNTTRIAGYYPYEQIRADIEEANNLYDNRIEREKNYSNHRFEFLLMIDEVTKLSEIINNKVLMKTIMCERLHIAEELVEKFYKITNQPVIIDNENLALKNITPSLLEKLNNGIISGFKTGEDGRILLDGFTIADKDLSHMDLSRFNFNNAKLDQCVLNNVKLAIKLDEKVKFEGCDLRGTNLEGCDMSNVILSNYYLCDDEEPNPQIWKNDLNFWIYSDNFNPNKIIQCLKKEKITNNMLYFAFKIFFIRDYVTYLKPYIPRYSAELLDELFSSFSWEGHNVLTLAIHKNETEFVQWLIERNPELTSHVITDGTFKGYNALTLAIDIGKPEFAQWLIERNPELALHVVTHGNHQGHNALTLAISENQPEVAKWLIKENPELALHVITSDFYKGHNALTLAINTNKPEFAQWLIKRNPEAVEFVITSSRYAEYDGCTPLDVAVEKKRFLDIAAGDRCCNDRSQELSDLIKKTLLNNEIKRAQALTLAENEHNKKQKIVFKSVEEDVYLPCFSTVTSDEEAMDIDEENKNNKRKCPSSFENNPALSNAKRRKK